LKTHAAFTRFVTDRGADSRLGRLLFSRLRAHGHVAVAAEARMFMWQCESPGISLMRANYEQERATRINSGYIKEQEIGEDIAKLGDADFMMPIANLKGSSSAFSSNRHRNRSQLNATNTSPAWRFWPALAL
jgi:hypothetical protein